MQVFDLWDGDIQFIADVPKRHSLCFRPILSPIVLSKFKSQLTDQIRSDGGSFF